MTIPIETIILPILFFLVAVLYSSVGHAGASGYLAVMALVAISPEIMRPTALILNILVGSIATYKYYKAGSFSWSIFIPLVISSVPLAFIGGRLMLPEEIYKPVVGLILILAAWRLILIVKNGSNYEIQTPSKPILLIFGGILGFLSGITGVGGGIFLSPLLVFLRWAPLKVVSGITAAFILVNSIAGILGMISFETRIQPSIFFWSLAVIIGGFIGSEFGSKHLGNRAIFLLLSLVLLIGGLKMILML